MHLLKRMKAWREVRRLQALVSREPSPRALRSLGRLYLDLGLNEEALELAERGVAQYPNAIELRGLRDDAERGKLMDRVEALRVAKTRSPSPESFQELADALAEAEQVGELRELCADWSERFPEDPACWLVLGRACLVEFYRHLAAEDGGDALDCLARAVELAPDRVEPRRLLSEQLYRIGAVSDARRHLYALRELAPLDEELAQLLGYVAQLPEQAGAVDELLSEVEEQRALKHPAYEHAARRSVCPVTAARERLARLARHDGVVKATLIRGAKAAVGGAVTGSRDPFLKMVRVSAKAAHRFARGLGVGRAVTTTLEGAFGRVCICVCGDALAAAQVRPGADVGPVVEALQALVVDAGAGEGAAW